MEKYNRWSDLRTGINPFVPSDLRSARSAKQAVVLTFFTNFCRVVFCVLKVPVLGLFFILLILTNLILVTPLSYIPFLGRFVNRLLDWLLCGLILCTFGVFVKTEQANVRRLGLQSPGVKKTKSSRVAAGDVIIANHTGFLDILYFAKEYSPLFVFPTESGASKGLVYPMGLLGAIKQSISLPIENLKKPMKLSSVITNASGPIVIFPEGIRSNGKAILKFIPILNSISCSSKKSNHFFVHAIRFDYKKTSPNHTAGSGWAHGLRLCMCIYHTMRVIKLDESYLPTFPTESNDFNKSQLDAVGNPLPVTSESWNERIRDILSAILRVNCVDLSPCDFISFTSYWNHVNSGGRRPASEFTQRKAPHEHAQWTK